MPFSFTHDGATIVVDERGPRDAADGERDALPTVVLVHGMGMGRAVFGELGDLLAPHARVVAMDLPGYGDAPEPPRTPTMARTADLIAAYLVHADARAACIVGHSMGTQIAVELAVRHPHLVERLVLIGPTVDPAARSVWAQLGRLLHDLAIESPKVLMIGAREYLRAGPNLGMKLKAMLVHRPEELYPRVPVPALVMRGEEDRVAPRAWCRDVAALLPDGRLVEIDGHGHETMIRDATPAASRIIAFLTATAEPVRRRRS